MEQEQIKNAEKNFRTDAESLFKEIKAILADFFVCDLTERDNVLLMRLENGQTFQLTVREAV